MTNKEVIEKYFAQDKELILELLKVFASFAWSRRNIENPIAVYAEWLKDETILDSFLKYYEIDKTEKANENCIDTVEFREIKL